MDEIRKRRFDCCKVFVSLGDYVFSVSLFFMLISYGKSFKECFVCSVWNCWKLIGNIWCVEFCIWDYRVGWIFCGYFFFCC